MVYVFILLFLIYFLLLTLLIAGWKKITFSEVSSGTKIDPLLSIIIPARNEGKNIQSLLTDIQNQTYKNFEVIVVNDSSTDNTWESVDIFVHADARFRLIDSLEHGKKKALTIGVQESHGEIVVTTDADCRVQSDWLKGLASYFQQENTKMVFGGVRIQPTTFFSELQAHEFVSLIGTAASTLALGVPTMCNGANLAYRKSVFEETGGYTNNFHIASGDDEFLMHNIFHRYPNGVRFVAGQSTVVLTSAAASLREFLHQRIRWAGKWRFKSTLTNAILAVFILSFHFSVLFLPLAAVFRWIDPLLATLLFSIKITLEWIFLKDVAGFLKVSWKPSVFFILQVIYPFYAVFVGLTSTFFPFEWKGRKLKSVDLKYVKHSR
jgi:cellulose synthase/poly-beta-1,6-N-acetylglucosamine synthase-like glycosyltransferase